MKTTTPILTVVRAMHAEQDARDPYNHGTRRMPIDPIAPTVSPGQVHEATQILKCFEEELTLS